MIMNIIINYCWFPNAKSCWSVLTSDLPLRANSMDLMAVVLLVPVVTLNEATRSCVSVLSTRICDRRTRQALVHQHTWPHTHSRRDLWPFPWRSRCRCILRAGRTPPPRSDPSRRRRAAPRVWSRTAWAGRARTSWDTPAPCPWNTASHAHSQEVQDAPQEMRTLTCLWGGTAAWGWATGSGSAGHSLPSGRPTERRCCLWRRWPACVRLCSSWRRTNTDD